MSRCHRLTDLEKARDLPCRQFARIEELQDRFSQRIGRSKVGLGPISPLVVRRRYLRGLIVSGAVAL